MSRLWTLKYPKLGRFDRDHREHSYPGFSGWYWMDGSFNLGGHNEFRDVVPVLVHNDLSVFDQSRPLYHDADCVFPRLALWRAGPGDWIATFDRMETEQNKAIEFALWPGLCSRCKTPTTLDVSAWRGSGRMRRGRPAIAFSCECWDVPIRCRYRADMVEHPWDAVIAPWAGRLLLNSGPVRPAGWRRFLDAWGLWGSEGPPASA